MTIQDRAVALGPWYHKIQLTPEYFTESYMADAMTPTWDAIRKVRDSVDYKAKSVLDLGTMDGMWAFEAEKLGAKCVVGGDIWQGAGNSNAAWPWQRPGNGIGRFLLAREALGSSVVPVTNAEIHNLHERIAPVMRNLAVKGFDIIQCLGLLYHVQNPLMALHQIRRCLAPEGVLLLETACWLGGCAEPVCRLNRGPLVYQDRGTYWLPNYVGLLEMLKLVGFEQVGMTIHLNQLPNNAERVILVCYKSPVVEDEDHIGSY